MAYNKVDADGKTLIDLTSDTITADTLVSGRTAHLANGEIVTGTFEPVTGVKGNAESTYRKGDVNLTPANIGAATSAQGTKADSAVQTIQINGTTQTKTNGTVNLPAYPTKSSLGLGNVNNTSDANKPISTATQAVLDAQQAQIDKALEQTGYNLLPITATSQTINGVTFTVDRANGTITANGTATAQAVFVINSNVGLSLNYKEKLWSDGCPSGSTTNTYFLNYEDSNGKNANCYTNEPILLMDATYPTTLTRALIYIRSGVTVNNIVFKPMIVPAELAGIPFQPYAEPNSRLTQKVDSAVQTIKMNGNAVTKTSGVVDLGTVITAHQNISGKADKSATVSTITYDTTNKKLTKTINGTTSDIVTTAKLKTDMALSKSDVGLGNVGNFKAVSTVASQGLTDTEKANARTNIGAGTSSFSGNYADLANPPTIPPAVAVKGNAETNYRTGNVNLTPANIGAATSAQGTKADNAIQTVKVNGTAQTKTNNTVNISLDKSSVGLENVDNTSDLNKPISTATQAALDKQQAQVDKALEQTGYNLLLITATSQTINGVTFTVDKVAGTITANGTATAQAALVVGQQNIPLNYAYQYTISGLPSGSQTTYFLNLETSQSKNYNIYIDQSLNLDRETYPSVITRALIYIRKGQTVSNLVFKPMIVPAELAGVPFQPYAKSNAELTQDLDDISEELDCLTIRAALVNDEVRIQNTSDFTDELYRKYASHTKPKFAILKLQITSSTYYYKALLNSSSVSQATVMEAAFITVNGTYMNIYNFNWSRSGTVGTPTVSYTSLNLGS